MYSMKVFCFFVAAHEHHPDDGVFVGEVHIGYAAAPGWVGNHAVIYWHFYLALVVVLDNESTVFLQFLMLHGEFGCRHLAKLRDCLRMSFKNYY